MIVVDKYLDENKYDVHNNNCGHFVSKVWKDLTGQDVSPLITPFVNGDTTELLKHRNEFHQIPKPESPCLVVMHAQHADSHVGIFVEGRLLHFTEAGVVFEQLSMFTPYWRLTYYK